MKVIQLCLFAILAVAITGCNKSTDNTAIGQIIEEELQAERAKYEAQNADLQKRVKQLEQLNADLQAEWVALKASEKTEIVARVKSVLDENVETMIVAKLNEKLGDEADLSAVLRQTAKQEIVAFEKQKEAEAEAEREKRRQEEQARREQREAERMAQTAKELGLNDQQSIQLTAASQALRDTMREAFTAMRESGNFDREKMRELMTETRDAHNEEVAKFLNDDQLAKYLERQDRGPMGWFGGRDGGRGRGGPGGGR